MSQATLCWVNWWVGENWKSFKSPWMWSWRNCGKPATRSHIGIMRTLFTIVGKRQHIIIMQVDESTACTHPVLTCKGTFSAVGFLRILLSVITCAVGLVMNKRSVWRADCFWHQIRLSPSLFLSVVLSPSPSASHILTCVCSVGPQVADLGAVICH